MGYAPAIGACRIQLEHAPDVVARELRLSRRALVGHVERVRLADGKPVVLCHDYLDARLLSERSIEPEQVEQQILARGGSLYTWMEQDLGRVIDSALARIEPVVAKDADAAALGVEPGAALLRLRQTHYGPDGAEVLYSDNLHNSDVMHFHVVRRRARPTF
jgi:GntR family transcriptional regulator